MSVLKAILAILVITSVGAKPLKQRSGLFWQVTKPGSTDSSYLFGTLHLLEQSYVDTMPNLMRALDRADIVLGEIVLDSATKKEAAMLTASVAPLDSILTPRQYAQVDSELRHVLGMPLAFFNNFQPLAIYALLIQGLYKKQHPENIRNGVLMDIYFQQRAKRAGKEVKGLESLEDEADALFGSLTPRKQVHELMDLIKHKAKVLKKLDELLSAYRAGDLAKLLTEDDLGAPGDELMEGLLYKRNATWLKELPAIFDSHNAFVAVGAGHLGGPRGLVSGLRKLGYQVVAISPVH